MLLVKCLWTPFISLNSCFFGKQTQLKAAAIAFLCVALSTVFVNFFYSVPKIRFGWGALALLPSFHQSFLFKILLGLNIFVRRLHSCGVCLYTYGWKWSNLQKCGEWCTRHHWTNELDALAGSLLVLSQMSFSKHKGCVSYLFKQILINKLKLFNIFHVELSWVEWTHGNISTDFSWDTGFTLQGINYDNSNQECFF